jgi:hypothetical protein
MIPYKNRQIDYTKTVSVYKNINRDCYSIMQNGKVVAHTQTISLVDVTFEINKSGRQRVLDTKRKNVHAKVKGYIYIGKPICDFNIKYNPYKFPYFYCDNLTNGICMIKSCMFVSFSKEGVKGSFINATKEF